MSCFYFKKKTSTNLACGDKTVSPIEGDLYTSALYTVFPSVPHAEKHMLNFYPVALTLPLYVGLKACAEKMVIVVLDYNSANTADGDTTVFVYSNV